MRSGAPAALTAVSAATDDLAVPHDNGADGDLTRLRRLCGKHQCLAHKALVGTGEPQNSVSVIHVTAYS